MKEIEIAESLVFAIRKLPKEDRRHIGELISETQRIFGQSHAHRGTGLRDLGRKHYEVRLSISARLLFENRKDVLYFKMMGNHNDIKRYLKNI